MTEKSFRPMLSGSLSDRKGPLSFPMFASPKIDGVRCVVIDGKPMTRSMKVLPNLWVQKQFALHGGALEGLDGELIVGGPPRSTGPGDDVFNRTSGALMRHSGEPAFTFHVFDCIRYSSNDTKNMFFAERFRRVKAGNAFRRPGWCQVVPHDVIRDQQSLDEYEERAVVAGYEGIMLRDPAGLYKQGRSTATQGWLLKVKRHEDAEAIILGMEEEMENQNEATKNELGRTRRSSAAEGLVGKGRLGAFVVEGVPGSPFAGKMFNVGTGIDHKQRGEIWAAGTAMIGRVITYRYLPVGSLDAPRHPVFKGFRGLLDMDPAIAAVLDPVEQVESKISNWAAWA